MLEQSTRPRVRLHNKTILQSPDQVIVSVVFYTIFSLTGMQVEATVDSKDIARKIADGSYFEDARSWYMRKFIHPITERSFVLMVALFSCLVVGIVALNIRTLTKNNHEKPFVTYAQDLSSKYSLIERLDINHVSPQEALTRYLISDYVTTREQFIPNQMTEKYLQRINKKIKSSSSKNVLEEYQNYMSRFNPYSPFTRYQDGTSREITIKQFDFLTNDPTTGKARLVFDAIEQDLDENTKTSTWEAIVHYRIPNIETVAQTQAPLRFVVKYYKVSLLKS